MLGVFLMDIYNCLQTTLYTKVLVNTTKLMKKHPFCGARFYTNIFFGKISPLHPSPFKKSGIYFETFSVLTEKCAPPVCHFYFWFSSNPQKYVSIFRALIFSFILVYTQVKRVIT